MKASLQKLAMANPMNLHPEAGNHIKRFGAGTVKESTVEVSATVDCSASSKAVQPLFRNRGAACVAAPIAGAGIIDDAIQAIEDAGKYYRESSIEFANALEAITTDWPTLSMLFCVGVVYFIFKNEPWLMNKIKAFAMFGEWVDLEKK